jgi:ATPase subunit of ABC transporter with duplicated ATPase domains
MINKEQVTELLDLDDWGTAWKECSTLGSKWGGRGQGGRATGRCTVQKRDVVVEGVTMAYLGKNLLERTTLRLLEGHKYGLIGRNGVGKSTLIHRIASNTLPGFPQHLRVALVPQELPILTDADGVCNVVNYVIKNNVQQNTIQKNIDYLEDKLANDEEKIESKTLEEISTVLEQLYDMLDEDSVVLSNTVKILKGLGFGARFRNSSVKELSGGWRKRISFAIALLQKPDILLLDEPTNHLDAEGIAWIKEYLNGPNCKTITALTVSHDRQFLDDTSTDIILFRNLRLFEYVGNYSQYLHQKEEKQRSNEKTQDHIERQRTHMEETVKKMQIMASKSQYSTGMVASRKKKLQRFGKEKNDNGHRWTAQTEASKGLIGREGSQSEIAMGTKTGDRRSLIEQEDKETSMTLPNVSPLGTHGPLISISNASFSYCSRVTVENMIKEESESRKSYEQDRIQKSKRPVKKSVGCISASNRKSIFDIDIFHTETFMKGDGIKPILSDINLIIEQNAKVVILGQNGTGKTSLMRSIFAMDDSIVNVGHIFNIDDTNRLLLTEGKILKKTGFKMAYFYQDLQEFLPYDSTPLSYFETIAPLDMRKGDGQLIRAHLGAFGLTSSLVRRKIGTLSGGQKTRLVLAQLTIEKPHLLLLDEPTNNLDLDAVSALAKAIKAYNGAVLLATHDISFVEDVTDTDKIFHFRTQDRVSSLHKLEGGVEEFRKIVELSVTKKKNKLM